MTFKKFYVAKESSAKENSFCYMMYPSDNNTLNKLKNIQNDFYLKNSKKVEKNEFHITIRYVKLNPLQNPHAFIEYIKSFPLPKLKSYIVGFDLFGPDKDAFVAKLDPAPIQDWFTKINDWLTQHDYRPSDYQIYKPHITLLEHYQGKVPQFIPQKHQLPITLDLHKVYHNDSLLFSANSSY
jgi:2'-5' RNA ligase